jgi:putative membrane protein
MLLIHPVREVIRFIPALLGVFLAGRSSGQGHWWSLAGLAVVLVVSVMRWISTRFQITEDQISLTTGLVRRRTIAAPADRVRTVDVTEHALHRVLGLAKVSIGTGTSDRKRDGLVLDGLPTAEARALRAELLHRRQPAARPGQPHPPATAVPAAASHRDVDEVELLKLDPSWVRFAPFTLSGFVTALAVAGFAWNILNQAQVNAGQLGPVQSASRHLRDTPLWLLVVQLGIGVLLIITVLSIVGYLLAFWNFRLSRHPGGTLQITRGLITTRATSIEDRRLRGAYLSEPILLRAVGGARMTAIATGLRVGRGSERGGTVLAPPAPKRRIQQVAAAVLHGPDMARVVSGELRQHGRNARRRRLIRAVAPCSVIALGFAALWWWAQWSGWLALASLVLLAASAVLGLDRYRSLGHALHGGYLVTRYGSLDRRRAMIDTDGIIGWNLRETIFQRRLGLISVAATTAAGRQSYGLTDLEPDEAIRVARAATPGLLEPFLVPAEPVSQRPVLARSPRASSSSR